VHSLQGRLAAAALVGGIGGFFLLLTSVGTKAGLTFTGSVLETLAVALAVGAVAASVRGFRGQGRIRPKAVISLLVGTLAIVVPATLVILLLAAILSRVSQTG
jgi:hypothetical protein